MEEDEISPNPFHEAGITKDITRKENEQTLSFMNINAKK